MLSPPRLPTPRLARLFDDTAPDYDRLDAWLSLGSGAWYRRWALRRARLAPGMSVLDVAVGTGAVARAALGLVGARGRVVGVDPSAGMLARARRVPGLGLVQGLAEALPFRDGIFDAVTMGYALRHVADLRETFAEYRRVLRAAGRLVVLDFARPASRAGLGLARAHFGGVVPWLARRRARHAAAAELMRYCWASLEHGAAPEAVEAAMAEAGFQVRRARRWLGAFSEYVAVKR
jgi:demethylmenaquinone methyltransferase/2-methoxy-6-polyprenyl-1,4-benzoquinol methylase